ncbi:MAG: hypothetical protein ACK5AO_04125 [bacterium]
MALATLAVVVVAVVEPAVRFTILPGFKVPVTPASLASGQPSPSESKSWKFGFPSASVSEVQVVLGNALVLVVVGRFNLTSAIPP